MSEAKSAKNRMHTDLLAADLDSEVDRLLKLGASHIADLDEDGSKWTTLADPEGTNSTSSPSRANRGPELHQLCVSAAEAVLPALIGT